MTADRKTIDKTLRKLLGWLLDARNTDGHWRGTLSSSALSTAVATFALAKVDASAHRKLIEGGLKWLADNQNPDGGWGDTTRSLSNISTTMLCWSAMTVAPDPGRYDAVVSRCQAWIEKNAGSLQPADLARTLDIKYGNDRSFSAPILTMCAIAGRLGPAEAAWDHVAPLPFELAVLPRKLFAMLRLPVVSYALPALIAIGQAGLHLGNRGNFAARAVRRLVRNRTLKVLADIQPENGGFLEASPLTAFVTMSLAASDHRDSSVVTKAVGFLISSVRDDGSWPIDTDLATWLTTLSVNAVASHEDFDCIISQGDRNRLARYLLDTQYKQVHPYTLAEPGGWAWTNLPGAVPDADDTSGALIALQNLCGSDKSAVKSASAGIRWLMGLQNRDGGIPTFCRGWTKLPFDRSSPDITAHAVAAIGCWLAHLAHDLQQSARCSLNRAIAYLAESQGSDGSWSPLWFGNQYTDDQANPVYGTSRVIMGLNRLGGDLRTQAAPLISRAADHLIAAQNTDGGWGGAAGVEPSVEETALAVDALAAILATDANRPDAEKIRGTVSDGVDWLLRRYGSSKPVKAAPIGLYFASLWYFERLYPLIFTVSALSRARQVLAGDEAKQA